MWHMTCAWKDRLNDLLLLLLFSKNTFKIKSTEVHFGLDPKGVARNTGSRHFSSSSMAGLSESIQTH